MITFITLEMKTMVMMALAGTNSKTWMYLNYDLQSHVSHGHSSVIYTRRWKRKGMRMSAPHFICQCASSYVLWGFHMYMHNEQVYFCSLDWTGTPIGGCINGACKWSLQLYKVAGHHLIYMLCTSRQTQLDRVKTEPFSQLETWLVCW